MSTWGRIIEGGYNIEAHGGELFRLYSCIFGLSFVRKKLLVRLGIQLFSPQPCKGQFSLVGQKLKTKAEKKKRLSLAL